MTGYTREELVVLIKSTLPTGSAIVPLPSEAAMETIDALILHAGEWDAEAAPFADIECGEIESALKEARAYIEATQQQNSGAELSDVVACSVINQKLTLFHDAESFSTHFGKSDGGYYCWLEDLEVVGKPTQQDGADSDLLKQILDHVKRQADAAVQQAAFIGRQTVALERLPCSECW